ncbi:MAG: hypothetical protein JO042_11715, partial [Sinobacteraceae bacterium]|nr:hypothetical protein [Nevskiaceae bacterium]
MIRLGLIALIVVSSLLAASTWRVYGHTWDEPEHLAAGLELLDRGKYEFDTEHPPLARVFIALGPWLAGSHSFGTKPPDGTQEGVDILYDGVPERGSRVNLPTTLPSDGTRLGG